MMSALQNHQSFDLLNCTRTFQAFIQPFLNQEGLNPKSGHDKKFFSKLALLHAFFLKHGHVNVPISHPQLGRWTNNLRTAYQETGKLKLTKSRITTLNTLGFVWDAHKASFYHHFQLLKAFVREHGHANIAQSHLQLGSWANTLRMAYKKTGNPILTKPRIKALNKLGFVWVGQTGRPKK